MGWFKLLWTILFTVSVSGQELTTLLPQDDDACMRNEVTFSCTVRGSQTLRDLILAWSSPEYIGQGDPLRFTSENMPGMNNMSSMINGNVTAILISNTMIDGVPELVSELHIIGAGETSVITCSSESNQTRVTTPFVSSAYPGRPQNGEARQRSAGSCDFQVTWDRPTNVGRFDIGSYIIYVPSRNMMNVSFSTTIDLIIPNCRVGNNSIQVAAVNRFGCIGPNSSHIQLTLLEMQDPPSGGLPPGAVAGIAIAIACVIIALVIAVAVIFFYERKVRIQKHLIEEREEMFKKEKRELEQKQDKIKKDLVQREEMFRKEKRELEQREEMLKREERELEQKQDMMKKDLVQREEMLKKEKRELQQREEMLEREKMKLEQEEFRENLMNLYVAIKKDLSDDAKLSSVESLSQMMPENPILSKLYIKEAVKIALKTIKLDRSGDVKKVLIYLKDNVPRVLESFDNELQDKDTDVTMDSLIRAAKQNQQERVFDELIQIMNSTKPEIVEGLLRTMFEELQKKVTNLPTSRIEPGVKVKMEVPT